MSKGDRSSRAWTFELNDHVATDLMSLIGG